MEIIKLDSNSHIPIYQQIADRIRQQITEDIWSPRDKISSEEDLVKTYQCSRGTIRKAISLLVDEGVLTKTHGKGTYVSDHKISYPFAQELISFSESMQKKSMNYKTRVLENKVIPSTPFLQEKLGIFPTENIFVLKRIRYIDSAPAVYIENYLSADLFKGIENHNFEDTSLFVAMEKIMGEKISKGIRDFSAELVDEKLSDYLYLKEGDPILKFEQLTFNSSDSPLEYSKFYLRTDKYQVTSELSR